MNMHKTSSIMFSNISPHVIDITAMSIQPYTPLPIKKQHHIFFTHIFFKIYYHQAAFTHSPNPNIYLHIESSQFCPIAFIQWQKNQHTITLKGDVSFQKHSECITGSNMLMKYLIFLSCLKETTENNSTHPVFLF